MARSASKQKKSSFIVNENVSVGVGEHVQPDARVV